MLQNHPLRAYARITLECLSPLVVATGKAQGGYDNQILRDANDLPFIPGAALAGVLRHLWKRTRKEAEQAPDSPFGYQQVKGDEGLPSRITFTPALLVLANGSVVEGLAHPDDRDPIVNWLKSPQPLMRDRVRINARGAAADTGKYDLVGVPRGTRFRFELCWHGEAVEDFSGLQTLLELLAGDAFRLGANTRSGFGRVKPVCISLRKYDLRKPADRDAWLKRNRSLNDVKAAADATMQKVRGCLPGSFHSVSMQVCAVSPFRIGGGGKAFFRLGAAQANASENEKVADDLLYSEPTITWSKGDNRGEWQAHSLVIPASSIKGALRHRFEFHLRRQLGCYVEEAGNAGAFQDTVEWLFGAEDVRKRADLDSDGLAGAILFEDIYLDAGPLKTGGKNIGMRIHNSIDRFTGGTLDGALYSEEYLSGISFNVNLQIDTARVSRLAPEWGEAWQATLDDFCQGYLQLGAGGGKGMGHFQGKHNFDAGSVATIAGSSVKQEDVA
jgi:CRISPR/Cas system CSM-associated protein Csm3 (group 7 of RAMP superfamily)